MADLFLAEGSRLWARRMTRFFPIGLALLFVAGVGIAFLVISANDDTIDFLDDVAGGIEAGQLLGPVTSILPLMAFVIGASSIGADAKTGMLEQILTWEPRRGRFLAARLVTVFVSVAVLAVVLAAFLVVLLFGLTVLTDGTTDGLTGEFWGNVVAIVVRTGVASGLFAALGFGVTVLVDNSVGAIVGFVIYWFIVENLVGVFLPRVSTFLPVTNADAFANGTDVERIEGNVFSGDFDTVSSHGYVVAGLIAAAWVAAAVVPAVLAFARRDID